MDIIQDFYNNLASQYHKLFLDWDAATKEQAEILHTLFVQNGFCKAARVLDCACGIGTQAIGLAKLGYSVTASDISEGELAEAKARAEKHGVALSLKRADFCALGDTFEEKFDIIICMDNALPHMLSEVSLASAVKSIADQTAAGGMFIASIRDYDRLLEEKPPYSPPYIHETQSGRRISFQTWAWQGENYKLTQYIIDDGESLSVSKFDCEYRATRRNELSKLLLANGFGRVEWKFPDETGFYQPIVIANK